MSAATYETNSREETYRLGYEYGVKAAKSDVYCLCGDLGTGKTVFAKGFASALGITDEVVSPTFGIVNEYFPKNKEAGPALYHFDLYRISSVRELDEIGFEDYLYSGNICLIEWAELVAGEIPDGAVWIDIKKDLEKGENYRLFTIGG